MFPIGSANHGHRVQPFDPAAVFPWVFPVPEIPQAAFHGHFFHVLIMAFPYCGDNDFVSRKTNTGDP